MIERTVRYNHNGETAAIRETADYYDSIILPSHFVADDPRKIAGLIERLGTEAGIEFYIDPRIPSYRVGDNFRSESGELRDWDQALVDYYGNPIEEILQIKPNLSIDDLTESELHEVVRQQCEFQLSMVMDAAQDKLSNYIKVDKSLRPRAIIPWYIKIESTEDLNRNKKIIDITQEHFDFPVKPLFFVTPQFVSQDAAVSSLVEAISDCAVPEVFLWIEDYNKREIDVLSHARTTELVYEVAKSGTRPHLLYAGFFENLLSYFGNRGSGYGPAYQEHRREKDGKEGQSGGSGGTNRYYFPPAMTFLNFQETDELGGNHNARLCDCEVCDGILDSWGDIYKLDGSYTMQSRHYIESRAKQAEWVSESSLSAILDELENRFSAYRDPLGNSQTAAEPYHLNKWRMGAKHFIKYDLEIDIDEFESLELDYVESS